MIFALFACDFFFSFLFFAVNSFFKDFSFALGLVAVRNLLHTFVRAENELGLKLWTAFIR